MMLAALGISVFLKKYESEIKAITKREFAALTGAAFLGLFVGQYSFVKAVSFGWFFNCSSNYSHKSNHFSNIGYSYFKRTSEQQDFDRSNNGSNWCSIDKHSIKVKFSLIILTTADSEGTIPSQGLG